MSKTLKPGLYKATVRGVADQIVMVHATTGCTVDLIGGSTAHQLHRIYDARPLIVLDTNPITAAAVAQILRVNGYAGIGDQILDQTKPPRIPEPGLYGVVEARRNRNPRDTWLRTRHGWSNGYFVRNWADIDDPTLIREGIN
jgi:hypothetical protein